MRLIFLLFATALLSGPLSASPANADPDAKDLIEKFDAASTPGKQTLEIIVMATGSGIRWANAGNIGNGLRPLFCEPMDQSLTMDDQMALLRAEIIRRPDLGEKPLGLVMLQTFEDSFPCSQGSSGASPQPGSTN